MEPEFTEETTARYTWDPFPSLPIETYRLYHCLRQRIHRIQKLLDATTDTDLHFALRMWQDAHIPMAYYYKEHKISDCTDKRMEEIWENLTPNVDRMFHEGELPNVVTYIPYCNYWKQTKKKKNFTFIEAVIWLISKAIPWRCNVRAIRNTFTKDCLPYHPKIYQIVVSFLTCSMLGAYRHAKSAPGFDTRLSIYGYMIFRPLNREFMVYWFQQQENQSVLQNIIREFVVYGTAQIPPLRESMIERHHWNLVEESCYKAMDKFREHIDTVHMGGSVHWFKDIKSLLADFDTYHLRFHEARPNPRLFVEKMAEECTNYDDAMFGKQEYREEKFTEEENQCLREMIKRCPKDRIPFFLLAKQEPMPYYKRDPETDTWEEIFININKNPFETDSRKLKNLIELMYNFYGDHDTKPLGEYLGTLTVYEYQKISNFFYFLREQQTVRLLVLPMHYYEQQLEALCIKHRVSCAAQIPKRAGLYYYSVYCGFKGFVVPVESVKQRTNNLNASGSHEAMFSFDKGKVYCFHKVNKSKRRKQNPRKRTSIEMFSMFQERNYKRMSKDNRRQKMQNLCSKTPLQEISLIGFAIECQDGLITLCCNCGNPATFGVNKFEGSKFVCTQCTKQKNLYNEVTCFYCQKIKKDQEEPFVCVDVYDDLRKQPPCFSSIHLCKKCKRKWITQGTTIYRLSVIIQGIKEKWRSHKNGGNFLANMETAPARKRTRISKKSTGMDTPVTALPQ